MKAISAFILLLLTASPAMASGGGEIAYLLNFVGKSDCTFIRNGKEYNADKAAEHLAYKYSRVKSRIPDADVFINRIASASSITKTPYEVQCGNERKQTREWLNEALEAFRKSHQQPLTE